MPSASLSRLIISIRFWILIKLLSTEFIFHWTVRYWLSLSSVHCGSILCSPISELLENRWLYWWLVFVLFLYLFLFCAFGPSNKNETRYRVTIMSLLTTLWVYISQSTSPFSVMWPARPIQLGWCCITWPRHGQSSGCTALWLPSMLSTQPSSSPTLTKTRQQPTCSAHTYPANLHGC